MKEALIKEYAKMFTEKVAVIHSAFDEKPTTVAFVEVAKELSDEDETKAGWTEPWNNSSRLDCSNPARSQAMDIRRFLAT